MPDDTVLYEDFALSFIRGHRPDAPALASAELLAWARGQGMRLHKFKRVVPPLPRVRRVIGMLLGIQPAELLDVGSGRGAFLWPMMEALPDLPVTSLELDPVRVRDLRAVARGGLDRLRVLAADVASADLPERGWDVVTALEVLEHLPDPEAAARRLVAAARRFLLVTVPSQPDDNPEHLRLYTGESLAALLRAAGAREVRIEHVLNHVVARASV